MTGLNVCGIKIAVEKKRIKNMYIRVYAPDGLVKITAPLHTQDAVIRRFAESRAAWMAGQRQTLVQQSVQAQLTATEEGCFLWGERYPLAVVHGAKNGVRVEGDTVVIQTRDGSTPEQRAAILARFYGEELSRAIAALTENCQGIVGVRATQWRIRDMKTRWGSCNTREGRIVLNLRLAQKPLECLEYVIIHELCHLLEHGHNAVFWAHMDRFYPTWRTVRKKLNGKDGAQATR